MTSTFLPDDEGCSDDNDAQRYGADEERRPVCNEAENTYTEQWQKRLIAHHVSYTPHGPDFWCRRLVFAWRDIVIDSADGR